MDSYDRLKSVASDRISKDYYTPENEQRYNMNKIIFITLLILIILLFTLA